MQKISPIHKLTPNVQQVLESCEMAMPIFSHTHPKIIETAFSFPEFAPALKKKTVYSICLFLRYSKF